MCTKEPIDIGHSQEKQNNLSVPTAQHTKNCVINQMFSKHLKFLVTRGTYAGILVLI